jgi:large subunit ribosomal protein L9
MRIVLLREVKNLGKAGIIKEVPDGFARNFLLPQKMAEMATPLAIQKSELKLKKETEAKKEFLKEIQELKNKLEKEEILISAKEKNGKLFGSISQKDICEKLKEKGIIIKQEDIIIEAVIKKIGEYKIEVNLESGIRVFLRLKVEGEK